MKSKNVLILVGIIAVLGIGIATYLRMQPPGAILKCTIARGSTGCQSRISLCNCCWLCNTGTLSARERVMNVKLKDGNLIIDSDTAFPKDSVDYFEIEPNHILEGTDKLKARQFLLKEGKYQIQKNSKGGSRVVIPVSITK